MYRGALRCILSELIRQDRLVVADSFAVDSPKTKSFVALLKSMNLDNVLIVSDVVDENLVLASRNLRYVDVSDVAAVDPVSLISHEKVLITVAALKQFEESLVLSASNKQQVISQERIFTVLVAPHFTEKASILGDKSNQYTVQGVHRFNQGRDQGGG